MCVGKGKADFDWGSSLLNHPQSLNSAHSCMAVSAGRGDDHEHFSSRMCQNPLLEGSAELNPCGTAATPCSAPLQARGRSALSHRAS